MSNPSIPTRTTRLAFEFTGSRRLPSPMRRLRERPASSREISADCGRSSRGFRRFSAVSPCSSAPPSPVAAPAVTALGALLLQRSIETDPLPVDALSWFYLTVFQPLFFTCFGAAVASAVCWVKRARDDRQSRLVCLVLLGGALVGITMLPVAM